MHSFSFFQRNIVSFLEEEEMSNFWFLKSNFVLFVTAISSPFRSQVFSTISVLCDNRKFSIQNEIRAHWSKGVL